MLLKVVLPHFAPFVSEQFVPILLNPKNPQTAAQLPEKTKAAKALGLQLSVLNASSDAEIDSAFSAAAQQHVSALVIGADSFFHGRREHLVELAARYALPTIYPYREEAAIGGLMSYGINLAGAYYLEGDYAGRVSADGETLVRASRLTAKIDNNAIADGFQYTLVLAAVILATLRLQHGAAQRPPDHILARLVQHLEQRAQHHVAGRGRDRAMERLVPDLVGIHIARGGAAPVRVLDCRDLDGRRVRCCSCRHLRLEHLARLDDLAWTGVAQDRADVARIGCRPLSGESPTADVPPDLALRFHDVERAAHGVARQAERCREFAFGRQLAAGTELPALHQPLDGTAEDIDRCLAVTAKLV